MASAYASDTTAPITYLTTCIRRLCVYTVRHILLYMPLSYEEGFKQKLAKIFMNKRSQAVRLPKEFQFATSEVFIRMQGEDVVLSARPKDWSTYLTSGPVACEGFMEQIDDLPIQKRDL